MSEITGRLTAIRDDIAEELTKERPSSTRRSAPVATPAAPLYAKDDLTDLVEATFAALACDPVRVERFIHMLRKKAVRK